MESNPAVADVENKPILRHGMVSYSGLFSSSNRIFFYCLITYNPISTLFKEVFP